MATDPNSRRDDLDAWARLVFRMVAFVLGCVFVTYGLLFVPGDLTAKALPVAIGLGFAWPFVGAGVLSAFSAMRGRDANGKHNDAR